MMDKISVGEVTKIGVGFALGYLAYKLISLTSQPQETPQQKQAQSQQIKCQQQKNKHQLEQLQQLQQVLVHKSTNFELQTLAQNPQILTKKCLLDFFNQTYDILDADEIVKVVLENRTARRIVFDDLTNKYETYFRFVCTLDESIKYLVEKAQKDFAVFLNLDYQRVVDSIGYYLQVQDEDQCQGCQQFRLQVVQVMSATRQSLMNYLPLFNTPIPKPQLLQLLTYQSKHLEQNKEQIMELVQKMGLQTKEQEQAIPLFITCYMQDMIYETYKIESEQMNISFEDMDQELRNVFQKWKSIREDVIRSIHQAIVIDHVIIRDGDQQY